MAVWPVNEAKSRFSELIEQAQTDGPQLIRRHGKDRAVVLSIADYEKLEAVKPDFRAYLLSGPRVDGLEVERSRDSGRAVEL